MWNEVPVSFIWPQRILEFGIVIQEIQQHLADGNAQQALRRFFDFLREDPTAADKRMEEMGNLLVAEYDRLSVQPVHEFLQLARQYMPPDAAEKVMAPLKPKLERTQHWMRELDAVTRERLGREARKAVTLKDLKTAARDALLILNRARNPQDRDRAARFVIEALGSLYRDADRAQEVFRMLAQAGAFKELTFDWREAYQETMTRSAKSKMEESNREWTQIFIGACADMRGYVPSKGQAGEPTDEQVDTFVSEVKSLFRAALALGSDEDLVDALYIIREYCPTDPPEYQSAVGVEARMFLELGPRAKLTSVRGLAKAGECDNLRLQIVALAHTPDHKDRVELFAAIMGGLRHDDFFFYLKTAFRDAETPKLQEAIADGLSRIANPETAEMLIIELAKCMKRIAEPSETRRAKMLLTALGRIARSKGVTPERRNEIAAKVIQNVGEIETDVSVFAANQIFAARPEEIDRGLRIWAAKVSTKAMFSTDSGQKLKASSSSPLGFRQPLVTTLLRLGKEVLPEVLRVAESHAGRYSGAFNATGELLQKIGDERAVALLERMIRTTLMQADEPASYLLKEMVFDPVTGGTKELDRDEVAHTLLFTLEKVGAEPGKKILLGLSDQIQAGQITAPGGETSSFLLDFKRRHGTIGKREAVHEEAREEVPDEIVEKMVGIAKGGLFANKIRQVEALSVLGRARRADTLGVIFQCMQAKDLMLARAAETAFGHFVDPLPSPREFEQMVISFFELKKSFKGELLERILQVIQRTFPKRPPYSDAFLKHAERELTDGAVLFRMQAAFQLQETVRKPVTPEQDEEPQQVEDGGEGSNASEKAALDLKPGGGHLTDLDRKKAYFNARKAWLDGGKKGPPPEPPA